MGRGFDASLWMWTSYDAGPCPPLPVAKDFASPFDGGMGRRPASPGTARTAPGLWGFGLKSMTARSLPPFPKAHARQRRFVHAVMQLGLDEHHVIDHAALEAPPDAFATG